MLRARYSYLREHRRALELSEKKDIQVLLSAAARTRLLPFQSLKLTMVHSHIAIWGIEPYVY